MDALHSFAGLSKIRDDFINKGVLELKLQKDNLNKICAPKPLFFFKKNKNNTEKFFGLQAQCKDLKDLDVNLNFLFNFENDREISTSNQYFDQINR